VIKVKPGPGARPAETVLGKLPGYAGGEIEVDQAGYEKLVAAGWQMVSGAISNLSKSAPTTRGVPERPPRRYRLRRPKGAPTAADVLGRPIELEADGTALVNEDIGLRLLQAGWETVPAEATGKAYNGESLVKDLPQSLARRLDAAMSSGVERELKLVKAEIEGYLGSVTALHLFKNAPRGVRGF
jgi:hypothetical protein